MDARVLIAGAGPAGLAAAAELHSAGVPALTLEARRRTGGRVWTVHPAGWPVPIALGADAPESWLDDPPHLRLGAEIVRLDWRRGHIEAHTTAGRFTAERAILALPGPVLASLVPGFAGRRLEPALRIWLLFAEVFWELQRLVDTRWNVIAPRIPVLSSRFEGRAARNLSALPRGLLIEQVIADLSRTLREHPRELARMVVDHRTHPWQSDPFSRGALAPPAQPVTPLDRTLFFAGDAVSPCPGVAGAIASGRLASRQLLDEG